MSGMDRGLVLLARSMLDQLHIPMNIRSVDELSSLVFALIYEGLCGEHIPELVRDPQGQEDEVHNCQLVLDGLSMDILQTSLSHITGEDLAAGDRVAISNLLEIFSGLMEYILNKIDSDVSSTDDDRGVDIEDPDAMTPDEIDDILQREISWPPQQLRKPERSAGLQAPACWEPHQDGRLESTDSLIREGELLERQDMAADRGRKETRRYKESRDLDGDRERSLPVRTIPSTKLATVPIQQPDLAATTQESTPELHPPERQPSADGFENVGLRSNKPETRGSGTTNRILGDQERDIRTLPPPTTDRAGVHQTYTHHLYHHYSQPAPATQPQTYATDRLVAPAVSSDVRRTESLERLKAEVDRTVQMSRDAVSPDRGRPQTVQTNITTGNAASVNTLVNRNKLLSGPAVDVTKPSTSTNARTTKAPAASNLASQEQLLSANIRERLNRIETESAEIHQLAASLNLPSRAQSDVPSFSRSAGPTTQEACDRPGFGMAARKVSFMDNAESVKQMERPSTSNQRSRVFSNKTTVRGRGGKSGRLGGKKTVLSTKTGRVSPCRALPATRRGYSSDGDIDELAHPPSSPENSPDRCGQRYRAELLEEFEARARRRPGLKPHIAPTKPVRRKAVDPLRETQIHVNSEDRKAREKTQYLRLLYEHELEDLKDELQQQKKEGKTNTDSEYKKKVLNSKKPKSSLGKPGLRGGRSRLGAGRGVRPKARRRSASASPSVGRRVAAAEIGDEERNLFGKLYEEFPYLYLSPETWHELWRQGIQQIERLTHSQQAARTKKNRGIAQLEEAEARQKILLGIMRKELAHNQRMREQKLKREQELSVKNKLHEKRMQSARSRKYFTEYQVRSRAKMLKRRTREEMVFKKLFRDGLEIQKERVKELSRYAKEQREIQSKQRQNDIDSLENYYRDQFEMLADSVARERREQTVREKAQTKILDQMKRELRKKMEREIEDFQDQLFRDDDDIHFRQLDADRLREELRVAKYSVRV